VPNFIETLEHQVRFNRYGYAGSEIEWRIVDGLAAPTWFENVSPKRFRFDDHDRPMLVLDLANAEKQSQLLNVGGWWWTARSGSITAATGLMRTACWWSHFKTLNVRDWLVWANRFGIPYVTGEYAAGETSAPDIETLKKAVKSLGRDGWAVFADTCKMVIHETKYGGTTGRHVHEVLTDKCDQQNSKLVAGATLMAETTGQASYAIGTVHSNRAFTLVQGDANKLAQSFETSVGLPFVTYNGIRARPPRLKIHVVEDQEPLQRAKVFAVALNELGCELDEDQVRQELQLKSPTGATLTPTREPRTRLPGERDR
jgi:phage gp29-like protein